MTTHAAYKRNSLYTNGDGSVKDPKYANDKSLRSNQSNAIGVQRNFVKQYVSEVDYRMKYGDVKSTTGAGFKPRGPKMGIQQHINKLNNNASGEKYQSAGRDIERSGSLGKSKNAEIGGDYAEKYVKKSQVYVQKYAEQDDVWKKPAKIPPQSGVYATNGEDMRDMREKIYSREQLNSKGSFKESKQPTASGFTKLKQRLSKRWSKDEKQMITGKYETKSEMRTTSNGHFEDNLNYGATKTTKLASLTKQWSSQKQLTFGGTFTAPPPPDNPPPKVYSVSNEQLNRSLNRSDDEIFYDCASYLPPPSELDAAAHSTTWALDRRPNERHGSLQDISRVATAPGDLTNLNKASKWNTIQGITPAEMKKHNKEKKKRHFLFAKASGERRKWFSKSASTRSLGKYLFPRLSKIFETLFSLFSIVVFDLLESCKK